MLAPGHEGASPGGLDDLDALEVPSRSGEARHALHRGQGHGADRPVDDQQPAALADELLQVVRDGLGDQVHRRQDHDAGGRQAGDLLGLDEARAIAQAGQAGPRRFERAQAVLVAIRGRRGDVDLRTAGGPDAQRELDNLRDSGGHFVGRLPVQQQDGPLAQVVQRDGGGAVGELRQDRGGRRSGQRIGGDLDAGREGLVMVPRQRLEPVPAGERRLTVIAVALAGPVADVIEVEAVEVVLPQALDHQIALEPADLGLAEVVPEPAAGAVLDGPVRMLVEDVADLLGAVGAVDEPGVDLDAPLVTAFDHVGQGIVSRRDALAHGDSVLWKNAWPPQCQTRMNAALRLARSILAITASASAGVLTCVACIQTPRRLRPGGQATGGKEKEDQQDSHGTSHRISTVWKSGTLVERIVPAFEHALARGFLKAAGVSIEPEDVQIPAGWNSLRERMLCRKMPRYQFARAPPLR
jgi:hypothetical protein